MFEAVTPLFELVNPTPFPYKPKVDAPLPPAGAPAGEIADLTSFSLKAVRQTSHNQTMHD